MIDCTITLNGADIIIKNHVLIDDPLNNTVPFDGFVVHGDSLFTVTGVRSSKRQKYIVPCDHPVAKEHNVGKWQCEGLPEPDDGWDAYDILGWGDGKAQGKQETDLYWSSLYKKWKVVDNDSTTFQPRTFYIRPQV